MPLLRQQPKLWIRAVMLAAFGVLMLFVGSALSGAQESEYESWSLMICSHPGASRHQDGSLLNGDRVTGDSVSIHPTHGDYTEAISIGGVWSNLGWGAYIAWEPLLVEHNDGTCSLRASFRIAKWLEDAEPPRSGPARVARAEYDPCPIEVPVLVEGDSEADKAHPDYMVGRSPAGNRIRSIRVWLNRTMNRDELDIPCDADTFRARCFLGRFRPRKLSRRSLHKGP